MRNVYTMNHNKFASSSIIGNQKITNVAAPTTNIYAAIYIDVFSKYKYLKKLMNSTLNFRCLIIFRKLYNLINK